VKNKRPSLIKFLFMTVLLSVIWTIVRVGIVMYIIWVVVQCLINYNVIQ